MDTLVNGGSTMLGPKMVSAQRIALGERSMRQWGESLRTYEKCVDMQPGRLYVDMVLFS